MKKMLGKVVAFVVTASMAVMPAASVFGADNSTTETVVETESVAEMEERAESVETVVETEAEELSETEFVANEVERETETVVTDLEAESDTVPAERVSDAYEESAVSGTPITAENDSEAEDDIETGSCGNNVTYTLNKTTGILTISGTGEMNNYSNYLSPFDSNTSIKQIVIEHGVTSIGDDAFYGCSSLASVTIPDSVTSIGRYAFYQCSSLTSVRIPDGVESIENEAFYECSSLTDVTIPGSVTSIGDSAFSYCSSLSNITILEGVTSIGDSAFSYCSSLSNITIPESVTSIGNGAFFWCGTLKSVEIPRSVISIGNSAFDSTEITAVFLPESIQSIGENAFWSTNLFTDASEKPSGWGTVDEVKIYFNSNVEEFRYWASIEDIHNSIILPDYLTVIPQYAFYNYSNLESIVIPGSIKRIDDGAFEECSSLNSVQISAGVKSIGNYAFEECTNLFSIVLPDGLTTIGNGAFWGCKNLTSIEFPNSVTTIGGFYDEIEIDPAGAFAHCTSLTSVILPDGLKKIVYSTFDGCNSLKEVYIPKGVKSIGSEAFNVKNKVTVYYGGTYSQWKAISIDSGNNFATPINYGEGLVLSSSSLRLLTNQKIQITYKAIPTDLAGPVRLTSSNPQVVTVDSKGNVTARTYGKATITASVNIDGTTYKKTCTVQTRYYDVANSSKYYYKPVYWAADKGITSGYGNVYFGTDENCTREQMITFLWRQAGKPTSKLKSSPFSDVDSSAYYYKAVLWAYEKGITKGYSSGDYAGMFGVGLPVTREDTVTFIYRMAGKPSVSRADLRAYSFPDEVSGAYYCNPIAWAAKNGITKGYTNGEYAGMFGVGLNVLRQDIVTFLYRYANLK